MNLHENMLAILAWLGRIEIAAVLLAILIVILRPGLRRMSGARWAAALWLVLLPRLLSPILPANSLGLSRWVDVIAASARPARAIADPARPHEEVASPKWTIRNSPLPVDPIRPGAIADERPVRQFNPAVAPAVEAKTNWPLVLVGLWACVAAAMLARLAIVNLRFARHVASKGRPAPGARDLLARCASEMGLAHMPDLLVCDAVAAPALTGVFRPVILLPAQFYTIRSPGNAPAGYSDRQTDLRLILLHELCHLKCRDVWLDWLWAIAGAVHWFNPAVWLARRAYRADRELARDAMVLKLTGPGVARAYGEVILQTAAARTAGAMPRPVMAGIVDRHGNLQRRISMIARFDDHPSGPAWLALPVLAVLVAIACTDSLAAEPAAAPATQPASRPTAEERQRTIDRLISTSRDDINQGKYQEALGAIDQIQALDPNNDFAAGVRQLVEDKVTIQKQREMREIYDLNAERQYEASTKPNAGRIPVAPDDQGLTKDEVAVQAQLDKHLPQINFDPATFTDAIEFFRDATGANIFVNWGALEQAGIDKNTPITLRLGDVKFSKALSTVLHIAGGTHAKLGYSIDQGVITISTVEDLNRELVTRVYDVRDLLVAIPSAVSPPAPVGAAPAGGPGSALSHDQLVDSLIASIIGTVAPDSWRDRGGKLGTITEFQEDLIITQTSDNQLGVAAMLYKLREDRPAKISLQIQFVTVNRAFLRAQPDELGRKLADLPAQPPSRMLLDSRQTATFLRVLAADPQITLVNAPRVTIYSGQWASIEIGNQVPYIAAVDPALQPDGSTAYTPRMDTVSAGITVNMQATVGPDRKTVTLQLHPRLTVLDGFQSASSTGVAGEKLSWSVPMARVWQMRPMIEMPAGSTMVLANFSESTTGQSNGTGGTTQPALAGATIAGPRREEDLYLLVTSSILPGNNPASAVAAPPASQPAR